MLPHDLMISRIAALCSGEALRSCIGGRVAMGSAISNSGYELELKLKVELKDDTDMVIECQGW